MFNCVGINDFMVPVDKYFTNTHFQALIFIFKYYKPVEIDIIKNRIHFSLNTYGVTHCAYINTESKTFFVR